MFSDLCASNQCLNGGTCRAPGRNGQPFSCDCRRNYFGDRCQRASHADIATFLSQFPVYTQNIVAGNEHVVTLFLANFSIGIGIGAVLCNWILSGRISTKTVSLGSMGMTVCVIIFYLASSQFGVDAATREGDVGEPEYLNIAAFLTSGIYAWVILLSLLAFSIFGGFYIVPLYALLQVKSDKARVSRAIAANNVINAAFMVASSLVIMALYSVDLKVTHILLLAGLLNLPMLWIIRGVLRIR